MPRLLIVVVTLFSPLFALAAPVPKLTAKKFENFGTVVGTKGVTCEMSQPGVLRVSLSKEATTESKGHFVARPLVTQKVEGDFELTVRVTHTLPADKDRGDPLGSAGIALYSTDDPKGSVVFLTRQAKEDDVWVSRFQLFTRHGDKGTDGGTAHEKLIERPIYLRLTRRGEGFTSAKSFDGTKWSSMFGTSQEVPGLGPVLIGPVAVHNTNGQYEVTFDEYVLTPLTEKRK